MRLTLISLGTLFTLFLLYMLVSLYGGLKAYQPYDHSLLNSPPTPWIIHQVNSPDEIGKSPEPWLGINVATTPDGAAVILPHEEVTLKKVAGNQMTPDELKKFPDLESTMQQNKDRFLFIEVINNAENADLVLKAKIERLKLQDHVIITSPYDVVLESLKKQLPRTVLGTGIGEKARLKILDSLNLMGVATITGDIYYSGMKAGRVSIFSQTQRSELSRRYVKWIAPLFETADFTSLAQLKPDAWVTDQPEQLRQLLSSSQ